ncbi:glutamine-hydrolyzing GMP synthase [Candidatus Saccharibacteria bacterium]|nr:glutamine-hydrolyzing GMP synthase [Candidatus Saccharibacteria bacterium]
MQPENTETVVILDFGSQYTQLIARKVRELKCFCVVLPFSANLDEVKTHNPRALIFSGGPNSVYDRKAPKLNPAFLELGVPVLAICYGMQAIAQVLAGKVERGDTREYGQAEIKCLITSPLFKGLPKKSTVWMSHGDYVAKLPRGFKLLATSQGLRAAIADHKRRFFGLQFHPEVTHTEFGKQILHNFLFGVVGLRGDWTPVQFIKTELTKIRELVGDRRVICALSGGVDSSVAATLVSRAVGDQLTCVFVDNGLLREGEYRQVLAAYKKIGLKVKPVNASQQFLGKLKGVTDPERKRKIIGAEFINVFDAAAHTIKNVDFLVQGTLYPDVIESVSVHGPSAVIKSHHNVGGLPKKMKLKLIEPLRELFKDEVRVIGKKLGLPSYITQRQPFPGPGLAIRILGDVTADKLKLLRAADTIVTSEIEAARGVPRPWQYFAVLLPINSVGVMGDARTYEQAIAIRAISSVDVMTADWSELPPHLLKKISSRIVGEIPGINRVVYDITSKPPGTVEWE